MWKGDAARHTPRESSYAVTPDGGVIKIIDSLETTNGRESKTLLPGLIPIWAHNAVFASFCVHRVRCIYGNTDFPCCEWSSRDSFKQTPFVHNKGTRRVETCYDNKRRRQASVSVEEILFFHSTASRVLVCACKKATWTQQIAAQQQSTETETGFLVFNVSHTNERP